MEEVFLAKSGGGNGPNKESTPDQPGDVRVIVKSMYLTSRWTGLPRFQTSPNIYPKPAQLESLRDETWEDLSEELGAIGNKCWWPNNLDSLFWPLIVFMYGCAYPFYLVDMREGEYRSDLWLILGVCLGVPLGAVLMYIYFRIIVSRLKALAAEIDGVVSKFQGTVESEGYFLEYFSNKEHVLRSYEVRFRPTVSGGTNQPMPVAEKDTKLVQAEYVGKIFLFYIGIQVLSRFVFD